MAKEKKEKPKVTTKPEAKKPKGIIEVGDPEKLATVDKGVKKVLYKGEVREIIEYETSERERELMLDKDSVSVLDSEGNPSTIYLE